MSRTGWAVHLLILFSIALGALFLWQAYALLPASVFNFVAFGWVLFVIDGVFTFVRPRASYYFAFILAVLALASSLPQSAHYAFIQEGVLLPAATFLTGSLAQFLLLVLIPHHFLCERRSAAAGLVQSK